MISSPFGKMSKSSEKKLTKVLLISLIILIAVMRYLDAPLRNPVSTSGIVSFELAKDLAKSQVILASWDIMARSSAGISLGTDFLFLLVYSSFIALLIHKLNEHLWKHTKMYKAGVVFIWSVFLAAFFDIIENVALIQLLLGDLQQKWSTIAYYFAILKFSLLVLSICYIVINVVFLTVKKQRPR
jgi:hypothetical protein